jgi:maltooligosyltrehalose synthase
MAFGRGDGFERLIAAVPRWLGRSDDAPTHPGLWQGTTVPVPDGWPARWRCALSGRTVERDPAGLPVAALFAVLPVALLLPELS